MTTDNNWHLTLECLPGAADLHALILLTPWCYKTGNTVYMFLLTNWYIGAYNLDKCVDIQVKMYASTGYVGKYVNLKYTFGTALPNARWSIDHALHDRQKAWGKLYCALKTGWRSRTKDGGMAAMMTRQFCGWLKIPAVVDTREMSWGCSRG
jgi:hypothetical protein